MSTVNPLTPFPGTNAIIDSILATLNRPENAPQPEKEQVKADWQVKVEAGLPLEKRPITY